jgi:hypothetical protein
MITKRAVWRASGLGLTEEVRVAKTDQVDVKSLARVGAAIRLAELEREIAALRRVFPGLRVLSADVVDVRDPKAAAEKVARRGVSKRPETGARKKARRGRQTPMTAAEKQAVSDRMKKYWAAKQAEKNAIGE